MKRYLDNPHGVASENTVINDILAFRISCFGDNYNVADDIGMKQLVYIDCWQ